MSNPAPTARSQSQPARPGSARVSSHAASSSIPADSDTRVIPLSSRNTATTTAPSEEEKRCWICYVSDSEDDAPTSDWKSPCKCSLVAHESCLLDWIADMQKTSRENGESGKLACPQCKTPIRLNEHQSMVLNLADVARATAGKAAAFVAFGGSHPHLPTPITN